MSRRAIKRPLEQESMYRELTDKTEPGGIFSTYKDVFMLAGIMGFMHQRRISFNGSLEGIKWHIFNMETDETIINAVALAETQDVTILNSDDETFDRKITIFEEYAAGGLKYLYERIMQNPKQALDEYLLLLKEAEVESPPEEKHIKEIADLLF